MNALTYLCIHVCFDLCALLKTVNVLFLGL